MESRRRDRYASAPPPMLRKEAARSPTACTVAKRASISAAEKRSSLWKPPLANAPTFSSKPRTRPFPATSSLRAVSASTSRPCSIFKACWFIAFPRRCGSAAAWAASGVAEEPLPMSFVQQRAARRRSPPSECSGEDSLTMKLIRSYPSASWRSCKRAASYSALSVQMVVSASRAVIQQPDSSAAAGDMTSCSTRSTGTSWALRLVSAVEASTRRTRTRVADTISFTMRLSCMNQTVVLLKMRLRAIIFRIVAAVF
mmetsp:Transcript_4204/g.16420  ORF Transcript_4204/g.16420 Transcript_4204/m.16420 type:complete len:256 (-) Transcript_4204:931-1698(-)